ncbi:hypothetical protein [Nocardioides litoris]|uniref:hypothetical protein n=1 Tax=Nocardioides litoris TaxID=1926648 RepID=UPI0011242E17|nr:hypothetical protein [Nocardioides litoris]
MPARAENPSRPRRALLAALAGTVLLATALVAGGPAAPAQAAACTGSTGVTVVVDPKALGGGVQGGCVPGGGGRTASSLFPAAGFALTYVQRQPGFVCRVAGKPASDRCVSTPPASAYWGLWWSDGRSGRWTYSSLGAGSLEVPDGGYVAFAWDATSGEAPPSYAATKRVSGGSAPATPAPTRTPEPTREPTREPEPTATPRPTPTTSPTDEPSPVEPSTAPSAPVSPAPTTAPRRPRRTEVPTTSASPAAPTPSAGTSPATPAPLAEPTAPTSSEAAEQDGGGLPGWLAPLVVVLLLAVAGAVALLRRRAT